ncbi:hypothetical protein [Desulfosporosinus metallidurans]|uniref:Uncharacterized protein n=1 Tax=Desulfosporosinus metallidurans TaxID=1888891 RepID=A0A1Q8R147_9FIRM|nr:hypothetical protein [Desulfosporosinus metallidurans]OLN33291.1 hypothetical protein DSOL_0537 [Desulfosporosinus metallidurans]
MSWFKKKLSAERFGELLYSEVLKLTKDFVANNENYPTYNLDKDKWNVIYTEVLYLYLSMSIYLIERRTFTDKQLSKIFEVIMDCTEKLFVNYYKLNIETAKESIRLLNGRHAQYLKLIEELQNNSGDKLPSMGRIIVSNLRGEDTWDALLALTAFEHFTAIMQRISKIISELESQM